MGNLGSKQLATFSRQLGTMVESGLPIRRALQVMEKGARGRKLQVIRRIGEAIEDGATLSEAMDRQAAFPPLFLKLIKVGETAGVLDKVLARLADYYDFVRAMWGRLISRMVYPVFQYWALILVLALVTYIGGMMGAGSVFGFKSPGLILLVGVGVFISPFLVYLFVTRVLGMSRIFFEIVINIPVIGGVLRALALARFSWSMELMLEAGVPILDAIEWSMAASANPAFEARTQRIQQDLKDGVPLHEALGRTSLFDEEYIEMIHVGETSGNMPDSFGRLAKNYFDKADTHIKALTSVISGLVWAIVAGVIIFFIFKVANQLYGAYQDALNDSAGRR